MKELTVLYVFLRLSTIEARGTTVAQLSLVPACDARGWLMNFSTRLKDAIGDTLYP